MTRLVQMPLAPLLLPRRRFLAGAAAFGMFGASAARAELQITLSGGDFKPMPIAIAEFGGEAQVASVIANNLTRSGLFALLDKARHPEKPAFDAQPNFPAWQAAGVQALVTGRALRDGNRIRAEFRLWDIGAGAQSVGQQYSTDANAWRRVGHMISDAIYSKVTGEKGFFDTRIVYVDESGPKNNRKKRLAIMDQDGANHKILSTGDALALTPRFSPSSQEITYMSFVDGAEPRVFLVNLQSGKREAVGNFPGMSFSPRFSPDGNSVIMSLQQGGNANIYVMSLNSQEMRRLTNTAAIDTGPSFSPDGGRIVFESDRGGGQQIYIMDASGGGQKRISFGEGRYGTPVWSPKGDYIAFTRQKGGSFAIGIMKPDGSGERILTEGFHNEGPTWAPNGRYLMYFSDQGGGPKLTMVDISGRVKVPVPTPGFGSDPAWSPLLGETK
ncbi:MAG TPA: Tol-Pal system beta propeller repeat protein TolB [Beijerinckiaceae bacterium]|nr:Tol-Pal system beta propeller repeat protein TolB [Beijerinckiaceae bacterium]